MSLLTYWIVKNSHILAGTYFIFLKNVLYQTWKAFKANFGPQWKDRESKYQVRQILTLFCKLVAKVKTMSEVLQLQKSWNKSNLKESGDGVGAGNCFQRQSFTKYLRQTHGKVQFLFLVRFLQVLTKCLFRVEDWALGNNCTKFWDFTDIS